MADGWGDGQVPAPPAPRGDAVRLPAPAGAGSADVSTSAEGRPGWVAPSGGWAAPGGGWPAPSAGAGGAAPWDEGVWQGGGPVPRPRRSRKRRAAVVAVVAVVALLVIGGMVAAGVAMVEELAGWSPDDWVEHPTTFGPEGSAQAFALAIGDCASGTSEGSSFATAARVPCSDDHEVEVYATVEVPAVAGDAYPGRPELESYGYGACELAFLPYVGARYIDSEYDYRTVVPSPAAWDAGARHVHCLLTPMFAGTSTGSARGSGN